MKIVGEYFGLSQKLVDDFLLSREIVDAIISPFKPLFYCLFEEDTRGRQDLVQLKSNRAICTIMVSSIGSATGSLQGNGGGGSLLGGLGGGHGSAIGAPSTTSQPAASTTSAVAGGAAGAAAGGSGGMEELLPLVLQLTKPEQASHCNKTAVQSSRRG